MKMKFYLSGPVGNDKNWSNKFKEYAKLIEEANEHYKVVNPMLDEHVIQKLGMSKADRLIYDFLLLDKCDAIVMLPGWEEASGCWAEWGYAMAKGLNVYVMDHYKKFKK